MCTDWCGFAFESPDIVLVGKPGKWAVPFSGKESAANQSVGKVEEGKTFGGFGLGLFGGKAFHPGKTKDGTSGTGDELATGNGRSGRICVHGVVG